MTEFVITDVDQARDGIHWLARRRRLPVRTMIQAATMRSTTIANFVSPPESKKRTKDTSVSLLIMLIKGNDHRLIARPAGGKHLQINAPGALPMEIRAAGGDLLEVHLDGMQDLRTLGATLVLATGESLSALSDQAGVSQSFTIFVSGSSEAKDLRLKNFLAVVTTAGFELVIRPRFANQREARRAERLG